MGSKSRSVSNSQLEKIAERFDYHGRHIYGNSSAVNSSPLYAHLAVEAAQDPDVLMLVTEADWATQINNLLFAAVHYLLLGGIEHPLVSFYPGLTENPLPPTEAYPHFRAFCLEHASIIRELVNTRRVQTNEVTRCAGLLPAFNHIYERMGGKPLALLEIGTSAGLHLLWDRYYYDYEATGSIGDASSPVHIHSTPHGQGLVPLPKAFPSVNYRVGLDLRPIDVFDNDAIRWLQALIWPEHEVRQQLLKAAISLAQQHPVEIIAGNAADILPEMLEKVPEDTILCVFHSYLFTQMPDSIREQTLAHLMSHSIKRNLFRISQEWLGWEHPRIELFSYHQGHVESELLAYSESHGRWLEWL